MDRGLTRLQESSQESGVSGSRHDLPSTPDPSQRSRGVESDEEEGAGSGIDDQDNASSASVDGISDHETTENGHMDDISDHDTKENGGPNGMDLPEMDEEEGVTMDIVKKKRKTKKDLEVNLI